MTGPATSMVVAALAATLQQTQRAVPSDIAYEVTFTRATAAARVFSVSMSFGVTSTEPVLLSLPAWTPGSYDLGNFARHVQGFEARSGAGALDWDKADPDTWRVVPSQPGRVTVSWDYRADSLDNGMAWTQPDFGFFNGTNLFLYPDGADKRFPSRLTIHTEPDWKTATGLTRQPGDTVFTARDYHELVDMPVFVGDFDYDSTLVGERWFRLASYPAGVLEGRNRRTLNDQIGDMFEVQARMFEHVPFDSYTTLLVFTPDFPGGSALEHRNSHLGIYNNFMIGNPFLPLITGHEIFHAWNVKQIRPAQMVPYEYSRPQPTELLWVAEGLTDYYADLTLTRAQVTPADFFYLLLSDKITRVNALPPVALEDASLSVWIEPDDGTAFIYYEKGSLAGFMLDVLIRNASDNRRSLDDVMRALYAARRQSQSGFTTDQFWREVVSIAGNPRPFQGFHERYIDGRDSYPWADILPLAGMHLRIDSTRTLLPGFETVPDSNGIRIATVTLGSSAATAGLSAGDYLEAVAAVDVRANPEWRARLQGRVQGIEPGTPVTVRVRRGSRSIEIELPLEWGHQVEYFVHPDPAADGLPRRIRDGIMTGTVDR